MWLLFTVLSAGIWAIGNIFDSIIVHHYEPRALVQTFYRGLLRLPILVLMPFVISIETEWMWLLLASGLFYYLLILSYLYALKHIDASITQSSWALQAILLSIVGFLWFNETWSLMQTVGASLVLLSVFLLCYWHKHISTLRTVWLLLLPGFVGIPGEVILKTAADAHVSPWVSAYWSFLSVAVLAVVTPCLIPSMRKNVVHSPAARQPSFYAATFLVVLTGFMGFVAIIHAYSTGPLSLISIAGNVQPFLVILFAWLLLQTKTARVPKELLTKQSVQLKLACFSFVFVGLALLISNGRV